MNIRTATPSDLPTIVALNRPLHLRHAEAFPNVFRKDPQDALVTEAFRGQMESPNGCWLVAEEDNAVIGFLSAEFRQREDTWCTHFHRVCYLGGIVVDPAFRRRGVARALFTTLKQEATARETTQIELDAWAFNDDAIAAFAALGFQPLMQQMQVVVDR